MAERRKRKEAVAQHREKNNNFISSTRFTTMKRLLSVLFVLLIHVSHSQGKYISGHLVTAEQWAFLGRFCFLSELGRLKFQFTYSPQEVCGNTVGCQNILLYYDEDDQWPAVYPHPEKNCSSKEAVLNVNNNQVLNLTTQYVWSGCEPVVSDDDSNTMTCGGGRSFQSVRERWWYIAVSNCEGFHGLNIQYEMTLTNGNSYWTQHFSADEFHILETDITFLVLFAGILALSIWVATILKSRQLFHTSYKMYMSAVGFHVFSLFLLCLHYGQYGNDGVGLPAAQLLGRIFQSVSSLVFLLMLILLGKGYTVTRGRLSHSGSVKISVFMTLYTLAYAILFIYEREFFDAGLVLYLYESPAGYGLIGLQLLSWLWFCYAIFFTLKHYPEKSLFYVPYFFFYTLWFLAGPIMVLIAAFVISKWAREKIVNGLEQSLAFCAYTFFLILTRPGAANKNFPFHVRTSQIGIVDDYEQGPQQNGTANGGTGVNLDHFPHQSMYSTSTDSSFIGGGGPNFTELFTVATPTSSQPRPADNPPPYPGGSMDPARRIPDFTVKSGIS
ncbi:transmembrane protein 145-like isoform X1 [Branchiostoma floridae]|uniref:Transmembrane protein 145-like isoform X1 n=1 Tax=Branchiostoma floridae TaxID=7739 RepID=A0A9J7L3Z5_BRAFL|nr:transmembrane protein 145-like isoform X1 [Branchiostoma floridae]